MRFPRTYIRLAIAVLLSAILGACSTTKYVPQGQYLLDKVNIVIEPDSLGRKPRDISTTELHNYLRQIPNYQVFGFLKLQLNTYSLSGRDTTSRWNRWLRRIGQPPVILDSTLTRLSARQLRLAMVNSGYMDAKVEVDSVLRPDKKKAKLTYRITPGEPHRIASIKYQVPDSAIRAIVLRDSARVDVQPGSNFDRDRLEEMRQYIASHLQRRGYYTFSKEYITFIADTVAGSRDVDLTLVVHAPPVQGSMREDSTAIHKLHYIRNVVFITDYTPGRSIPQLLAEATKTVDKDGYLVVYGDDRYIKPSVLIEKCFITPGKRYNSAMVDRTYEYMAQLGIIKSTNIVLSPVSSNDDTVTMDAYILITRNKKQSVSFEVEGTNSAGDLGFGLGLTYQHRNIAHESQLFTAKVRTSYESLSGNLDGFVNNRYMEQSVETELTFPRFIFPFLSRNFKHNIKASSRLALGFTYQERPEYTRIIAGAAWKYGWNNRRNTRRANWDMIDVNYVRLPKSTLNFIDEVAPDNPLLRYSYEDHFIMRTGFTYQWTNRRAPSNFNGILARARTQPSVYNVRTSVETAGNLLYALSKISGQHKSGGAYKVFGIQYAQYVKGEIDYTFLRQFTPRHSLAFHAGFGIGYPYGNSTAIPFEKRFYAGGANGVRGWSVRTLGPGGYNGNDSKDDFMNQCGDINLILSMEYRAKLFWLLQGAVFVDAGNIWTIKSYPNQPEGLFQFDRFWRQIAMAYGIGLRMDFTYFIFRIDLGMKAYNPASEAVRWPIASPNWHRDATFHFAVGYPF